ncbi:hypothetical protein [Actinomyces trachealis]|uniref:hypothetical protein n=1 Tax=Actinomyces trachealis TaxID=2763540 RepID=UPI00189292D5|nr:hypothetical protein [Actinomyces trachealis]
MFQPVGKGTMVLAALVPVLAAAVVLRWGPRWRRREVVGFAGSGLWRAAVGRGWFLLRLTAVMVLAALVAVSVGLEVNAVGGFYTSWHDVKTLLIGG